MSEPKFKIGQWVSYGPPGQRRIVYTIVQKLPAESGGEPRYRIKAADEPHERVVTEAGSETLPERQTARPRGVMHRFFLLVLSKSRDWRHHDCSGAKPLFMDCNRGRRPDLGGTSIRSIRPGSRSNFQSRSFLLGGRRGLARDQSMAPLSWDNRVVLRALDTAPINASIELFRS
jgi:hypothetical protein